MCLDANHFSPKLTIKIEGQVSSETHFSCAAVPDVRHGQSTFLQIDHDPFLAINYDEHQGIQKFMSAPGRNPWQEEPQFCVGPPAPLCVPSCVEAAVSRAVYSLHRYRSIGSREACGRTGRAVRVVCSMYYDHAA